MVYTNCLEDFCLRAVSEGDKLGLTHTSHSIYSLTFTVWTTCACVPSARVTIWGWPITLCLSRVWTLTVRTTCACVPSARVTIWSWPIFPVLIQGLNTYRSDNFCLCAVSEGDYLGLAHISCVYLGFKHLLFGQLAPVCRQRVWLSEVDPYLPCRSGWWRLCRQGYL